ncbi:hypothetical protein FLAG1_04771 [Fusarium langsethiae]|uniref:Uncharacterized protein n=1 Tax=Fusarium langsethiae TaxID=179993 RepID=A0A0M9EYH0_FUSLA|nr:hypothetical protein FLAG1_04771 [Fusarium langsethiae]
MASGKRAAGVVFHGSFHGPSSKSKPSLTFTSLHFKINLTLDIFLSLKLQSLSHRLHAVDPIALQLHLKPI